MICVVRQVVVLRVVLRAPAAGMEAAVALGTHTAFGLASEAVTGKP